MLRWLKTVVVSDVEKAPVECQVGTRKMSEPEPLLTCRDVQTRHRNRGHAPGCGSRTWRVPDDWPGGVRHTGGMSLVCGSRMEHGKARRPPWRCAGGPARSSAEAPVIGVERRGRVICGWFVWSTGATVPWEELWGAS